LKLKALRTDGAMKDGTKAKAQRRMSMESGKRTSLGLEASRAAILLAALAAGQGRKGPPLKVSCMGLAI
jgi:hypothetical protein